ncbi:LOW QUALITY PROTEIN: bile acid-sensitive ion channel [Phaethornis superciliosus]
MADIGLLEKMQLYLIRMLPHLKDRRKSHQRTASFTSFHGVHNNAQTKSKSCKMLWLLVMDCLAIDIWQICSCFIYYFIWATTTAVVIQYMENIKIPAVTFCSLNSSQAWQLSACGTLCCHIHPEGINDALLGNQNFSIKEFTRENGFYLNRSTLLECTFFGPCYPQNLVCIDIKYHGLSYKITQQQKALSIFVFLADVGSQLGLFCGASVITAIELLEYNFINFCWMCIFLLLKAPEMPQWNNPFQNYSTDKDKKEGNIKCSNIGVNKSMLA